MCQWKPGRVLSVLVTCVILHLHIVYISALKHMELYMGGSEGVQQFLTVDGATIISRHNSTRYVIVQWVILMPSDPMGKFLIQIEYMDVPCSFSQTISLTEGDFKVDWLSSELNVKQLLNNYCDGLGNLSRANRFEPSHVLRTHTAGYGLHIVWDLGHTPPQHSEVQGFKLIITAYTEPGSCDAKKGFVCGELCISQDLLCDGVNHCLDQSDEKQNCTSPVSPEKLPVPMCLPSPCGEATLQWRFHHNTLTLLVPMVLALIFLCVAILWRNKRLLHRLLAADTTVQRRSPSVFESSEIATAEHETFYHVDMPEVVGSEPQNFDPSWGVQLPPPYSPRAGSDHSPQSPLSQDDLPPLYEHVVQENPPIPETVWLKPESAAHDRTDTST